MDLGEGFPELKNDLIIRAAKGIETERIPVWAMRQAGRHLPEFNEIRKKHSFFEICYTPELACEVTLQPVNRYNIDAAIIFSDILVIPHAMGMEIEMKPGVGPVFLQPLETPNDIKKLNDPPEKSNLNMVYEAIRLTRHKLAGKVPLLGFSGGPWTLFAYMIEGGGSKTLSKAKKWIYVWPEETRRLLSWLKDIIVKYLVSQVRAGAQMVQVFEVNAGYLTPKHFIQLVLPHIRDIATEVKAALGPDAVPMIIFAKDCQHSLHLLADIGYEVISLDWTVDPKTARNAVGNNITLQGNLDPCALYAPKAALKANLTEMVASFGCLKPGPQRYIANLGHGVYPDVLPENMATFVETIHDTTQRN